MKNKTLYLTERTRLSTSTPEPRLISVRKSLTDTSDPLAIRTHHTTQGTPTVGFGVLTESLNPPQNSSVTSLDWNTVIGKYNRRSTESLTF